jgi:hypothetical protein
LSDEDTGRRVHGSGNGGGRGGVESGDARKGEGFAYASAGGRNGKPSCNINSANIVMLLDKALPVLEKASVVVSQSPDPTILFLTDVLVLLTVYIVRPAWLTTWSAMLGSIGLFAFVILPMAVVWKKTDMFAALREGQNPLAHPAEGAMDDLESDLKAREDSVAASAAALTKSKQQLDTLRRELAKDPAFAAPPSDDALIIPNRKAAAMIAAGALGTTFDRQSAAAAEARRKAEAKIRSKQEWRTRTNQTDGEPEETKENLKRLLNHASAVYTARTKEIRTKTTGNTGDRFNAANLAMRVGGKATGHSTSSDGHCPMQESPFQPQHSSTLGSIPSTPPASPPRSLPRAGNSAAPVTPAHSVASSVATNGMGTAAVSRKPARKRLFRRIRSGKHGANSINSGASLSTTG